MSIDLTRHERALLLVAYGGGTRVVAVQRRRGTSQARLIAGAREWTGNEPLRALASLYSRGLVVQTRLNRFALSPNGRAILHLLRRLGAGLTAPEGRRGSPDRSRGRRPDR